MGCPNVNSPQWQELVGKIGVYEAFKEFVRHGENIPDPANYSPNLAGVNYGLQIVNALLQPPVEGWFERFYKKEKKPEVFFRKLLQTRAPKEQIDLLRDWLEGNTAPTLNDAISGLISEMAFTVSVDIAKEGIPKYDYMVYNEMDDYVIDKEDGRDVEKPEFTYSVISHGGTTMFRTNSLAEAENEAKRLNDARPVRPSQTYQFLSVPGGTNYREVEIRTPGITPARQGHGDFSTEHGIGWFRGDETIAESSKARAVELEEDRMMAIRSGDADETQTGGSWGAERNSLPGSRTRRILEIQSDLFQKERDRTDLTVRKNSVTVQARVDRLNELAQGQSRVEFEGYIYEKIETTPLREGGEPGSLWVKMEKVGINPENEFLQILNRDNNWVKFFIRSIIQDSSRKAYEKVRFPTGNTASRIQQHQAIDDFIAQREERIKLVQETINRGEEFLKDPHNKEFNVGSRTYFSQSKTNEQGEEIPRENDYYIMVPGDTNTFLSREAFEKSLRRELDTLEREVETFQREVGEARGPDGLGAFSKVASFYERDIHNILRKQGLKPERVKDEYGNEWYEVNVDPKKATSPIMLQQGSRTIPGRASQETLDRVREFLDRAGVDVKIVEGIRMNGKPLGINGITRAMEGLVVVVNNKEDVALPEEAMHVAVEIIKQTNPSLYREMFNSIGSYNIFSEVVAEYKNISFYKNADGTPNIPMIKQEAIVKVLTRTLLDQADGVGENAEFLVRTRTWWQKVLDWLKRIFVKTGMNPFESLASQVLEGKDIGTRLDIRDESQFAQLGDQLYDQLNNVNNNLAKTDEGYELNGEKVRHTVMESVEDFLSRRLRKRTLSDIAQANQEFREETEGNAKQDIRTILARYIDDNGQLRAEPLDQTVPSAIDPYNSVFYNTLEAAVGERLRSYPGGTRFLRDVNILDDRTSTAATVDLIAVLPDDHIDILQFKVPALTGLKKDIPTWVQEAYNIEIEGIRRIFQNAYGVSRNRFRQTRALPVRANYQYSVLGEPKSGLKVAAIMMGGVQVELIEDDVLIPVPSFSETSGDEQFDRFILRLRGLVKKLADERVPPDKRLEKGQRIALLVAAIRKLQVQKKADEILSSGRTIIRRQKEKFAKLTAQIEETDPEKTTVEQINELADSIMDEKDQIELYTDMNKVFRDVYTDDSEASKKYREEARTVSDDALDMLSRYWKMAVEFRKKKVAAKFGIRDEFNPEKQLSWYRRMIRSLSQSSIKAGAILWGLVKNINVRMGLDFQNRLTRLKEIEDGVDQWLKGRSLKDLYRRIFQLDKEDKWNGRFVQKYSKDFYTALREAQEKNNYKWVLDNIDVEAYKAWFLEEHKRLVENAKTARVHENDEENRRRIIQSLQDFVNTYSLTTSRGVNRNNYRLKDFPLSKWESDEYRELQKPENKAILDLYNYWIERLEESLESGMIDEHNGWSWFPNVRRGLLEKLTSAKAGGKLSSAFGGLRIEKEDTAFGKIDPLTGKPVDEVHASFVSDLGEWVEGADGKYFLDYSEKSMDIFKVLALWEREIIKFRLKTESESIARLLHYTEENRTAYKTRRTGGLERDENGYPITISNDINRRYIKEHIDAVYYNKNLSDESDIAFDFPYKATIQKINKMFGRQVINEPEEETITISGVKFLSAVNRFYVAKTLGLNVFTSLSNLFGGTVNTYINQGKFFDKKDILTSEMELVSGRFYGPIKNQKQAGLLAFFHPYTDDIASKNIRNRSVSWAVKFFSSDHLFVLQRGSEAAVNSVIAMSHIRNAMVVDGKIVNIREYVRKEMGYQDKYTGTYEQAQQFEKDLDRRVEELKESPQALLNYVQVINDEIVIPGIDRDAMTIVDFRHLMLQTSRDALGNTSREDLSLYKRSIMWQSFFMFKNWIPRMLDVRGQSLKYNPGSQSYEWGRVRMLGDSLRRGALSNISNLRKYFSGSAEPLVDIAKKAYKDKQREFAEQEESFDMGEAEFIDMYIKGVRSETKELLLAISLMGILVAVRAAEPDDSEDPEIRGAYKWMLRGLDKLQDEVSFFYNPISFTNIVNGSVFPAVHLLVEAERFIGSGILKIWYKMLGDREAAENQHPSKYLFRMLPITKELLTYLAIFNEDIAKEYNIRIQSRYGVFR